MVFRIDSSRPIAYKAVSKTVNFDCVFPNSDIPMAEKAWHLVSS